MRDTPPSVLSFAMCFAGVCSNLTGEASIIAAEMTVAADGSGDFRTVQEAIAAVPENREEQTILRIRPGTYEGQKVIPEGKDNITLTGDDPLTTILTWHVNTGEEQPPGTDPKCRGTAFMVRGNGFRARGITFQNTSGDHGQALALRLDGDRAVLTDCRLLGWQDTLMSNNGRHYFKDCHIEGRVDFIYGSGTAVFDHCEIKSKNGGYVTAASTPAERTYGFVFLHCDLTADPAPWVDPAGKIPVKTSRRPPLAYLGRPWRPHAKVAFIGCRMGAHIHPEGWNNWGKPENEKTARYSEGACTGPGAMADKRVAWSVRLDAGQAEKITVESVLTGADQWKP